MKTQEKKQIFTIFGCSFSFDSFKNTDGNHQTKFWCLNIKSPKLGGNQELFNNYILGLKLINNDGNYKINYLIRKQILRKI